MASKHMEIKATKSSRSSSSSSKSSISADGDDDTKQYWAYIECDTCRQPHPTHRCSRCQTAFYCSVDCQRQDWKKNGDHYMECVPIELRLRPLDMSMFMTSDTDALTTSINDKECGICLETPIQQPVVLPDCKHAFCFACLKKWQGNFKADINTEVRLLFGDTAGPTMAKSCLFCRTNIEQSVVQEALLKALRYDAHAKSLCVGQDKERLDRFRLAVAELDKILATDPDDSRIQSRKAPILVHIDPIETIKLVQSIIQRHTEGQAKRDQIMKPVVAAISSGQHAEATRLLTQLESQYGTAENPWPRSLGKDPKCLFELKLTLAQAYEATKRIDVAFAEYQEVSNYYNNQNHDSCTVRETLYQQKFCLGMSRILLQCKRYDDAIVIGQSGLEVGRKLPGFHIIVASAQRGLSRIKGRPYRPNDCSGARLEEPCTMQDAVKTMYRALVYEAPWDKANRIANRVFLQELLDEMEDCAKTMAKQPKKVATGKSKKGGRK